jgi:hypothetical protein
MHTYAGSIICSAIASNGPRFYECDSQRHRSLAELYVSEARFSEPWEKIAPVSPRYVHDAILANARRSG